MPVPQVIALVRSHFQSQVNMAMRKHQFSSAYQEAGESFDSFYIRLQQMADDTDLCMCPCGSTNMRCRDSWGKKQILVGIREESLRQRLLALPSSTPLAEVSLKC